MYVEEKKTVYRVEDYGWFQASTGGLECIPMSKGDTEFHQGRGFGPGTLRAYSCYSLTC